MAEDKNKKRIKPLKKKKAKPVVMRRPGGGHDPKLYKKGLKDNHPAQGTANTKEFLDKMDAQPGPAGYLEDAREGRVPAKGEKKVVSNFDRKDWRTMKPANESKHGSTRFGKDESQRAAPGREGASMYQTKASPGSKTAKYRDAKYREESKATQQAYERERPDRRRLKKSKPIKNSGKRSTRSKIGGAAMKVAGAVQKGKKAIRKINNKAGAVKNRMEDKVLKKKKKS